MSSWLRWEVRRNLLLGRSKSLGWVENKGEDVSSDIEDILNHLYSHDAKVESGFLQREWKPCKFKRLLIPRT
jgi:hypothetical protein